MDNQNLQRYIFKLNEDIRNVKYQNSKYKNNPIFIENIMST